MRNIGLSCILETHHMIIKSDVAIAWVKEEAELIDSFTHLRLRVEANHIGIYTRGIVSISNTASIINLELPKSVIIMIKNKK